MASENKTLQAIVAAPASFCAVILISALLFCACNRRKKKPAQPSRGAQTRSVQNRSRSPVVKELTSIVVDDSASFDSTLHISMTELVRATEMFSPDLIIGDGGFGWVYKATLSNGITVAIKKLSPDAFQGFREFKAEMDTLGKLQHPNIVKILGYCSSNSDRILVYEFIEKGSLDQWLYDSSSESHGGGAWSAQPSEKLPLTWETRVKIITGVASGLAYLHGLPKPIVHRDIKASNILLDGEFEAHIADFGLARRIDASHSHVSTQAAGTMGYMPPEYKEGLTVATPKVDIYGFGILMFEIFTGRRPNLPMAIDVENGNGGMVRKEVGLVDWAKRMLAQNKEMEMVDANIDREGLDEMKVKEYFKIASMCTDESSKKRPAMNEVVKMLNAAST